MKTRQTKVNGVTFEVFDSRIHTRKAKQTNLYDVAVNPKTGYIKFSDGILARKYRPHMGVRLYTTTNPETNQILILARFVSTANPSKVHAYYLQDRNNSCKNHIKAETLFTALGIADLPPFTAEVFMPEDKINDFVFAIPMNEE